MLLIGADDIYWGDNQDPENDFRLIIEDLDPRHALKFDGVNDWTLAAGVPGATSAEAIIRIQTPGLWQWSLLVNQDDTTCSHGLRWFMLPDGRLHCDIDPPSCNNGASYAATSGPLGHSWVHVATSYDGQVTRLYIDGQHVATSPSGSPSYNTGLALGATLTNYAGYARTQFEIAELRLWNYGRTQAQIQATLAENSVSSTESGLIALYLFNEGSGQFAHDSGPGNYTMRLGTSSSPDAADPTWITAYGVTPFGTGCAGSGSCTPMISANGAIHHSSSSFQIDLSNALGGSGAFLAFGLGEAPNAPLPYYLDPPNNTCAVLVNPLFSVFAPTAGSGSCSGTASYAVQIPTNCPPGFDFTAQWIVLDNAAAGMGLALSPALAIRL